MALKLTDPPYLTFPLRVESDGGELANRSRHVRDQIEQVLFTMPGERVFRPEFGAGVRSLVFEPNASALWTVAKKRLISSLADSLKGEVDPKSLDVDVSGDQAKLEIVISYTLAVIGHQERHGFTVMHDGW